MILQVVMHTTHLNSLDGDVRELSAQLLLGLDVSGGEDQSPVAVVR